MNHVTHPMSRADFSNYSPEFNKFCKLKKKHVEIAFDTKFLVLLTFVESLKIVLIKKVTIL